LYSAIDGSIVCVADNCAFSSQHFNVRSTAQTPARDSQNGIFEQVSQITKEMKLTSITPCTAIFSLPTTFSHCPAAIVNLMPTTCNQYSRGVSTAVSVFAFSIFSSAELKNIGGFVPGGDAILSTEYQWVSEKL
jgi:hypothetical protein